MMNQTEPQPPQEAPPQPRPPAAPPAPAQPRQTISISLKKSKKSRPTSKIQLQSKEEKYSTIAAHAEAVSKKRAEEGNVLVIPCVQKRDEGKPLLAGRAVEADVQTQDVLTKDATEGNAQINNGNEQDDDEEATRQLIESATNRDESEHKSSGLIIAAPSKNEITPKSATDDQLFQRDLSSRADDIDPTSSTYANVSIGDFGGALLRGMGWTGHTDTKKESEVKARPHRLGLGATPLLPPPITHGRVRRPEEVKKEEERQKAEQERERKQLEMQRLDVQFTLQKGSIVKLSQGRAKVTKTSGVPGLNRILVKLENSGREEAVNKGSVELCSWEDLEVNPFEENATVEDGRGGSYGREERDGEKKSDGRNRSGNGRDESDYDRDYRKKRKDSTRDRYSDDESRSKRRRKESSRDKYYSDDDSRSRKKRLKESSRDKDYSDDDSRSRKKRRKESSRDKYSSDNESRSKRGKDSSRDKYYSDDDSRSRKKRRKESSRDKHRKNRDRSEERDHSHSKSKQRDKDRKDKHRKDSESNKQNHLNWLLPHIRVRLLSKKYPRQHLQKGTIQDVVPSNNSSTKAIILMDNQEILENVPERYLETALPKTGGNVILLTGEHRWKKGRLLERNSEKGRGVVQLFEDLEVVSVDLDGVAEWCGGLDDDLG